jgi:uncharacterized membrane protein
MLILGGLLGLKQNLEDIDIKGNKTKKYSALNFVGIEATTSL